MHDSMSLYAGLQYMHLVDMNIYESKRAFLCIYKYREGHANKNQLSHDVLFIGDLILKP